MAFDPDEYLKGSKPTKTEEEVTPAPAETKATVSGFDPDAYLKGVSLSPAVPGAAPTGFDPDKYLSGIPPVGVEPKKESYGAGTLASDIGKLVGAGGITSLFGAPEATQAAVSGAARETAFAPTDILNLISNPQALTNKITGALGVPSIFPEQKAMNIVPEAVVQKQKAELDKVLTEGKIQSLRDITEYGSRLGKQMEESISPEMKDAMAMSQPSGNIIKALDTGDFSQITFGEAPSALGLTGQFAKVFGSTAPIIATTLITRSATPGAVVGFGQAASEGVGDAREHIKAMSDEQLTKNSEYFRNLILLGYDPAMARKMTEDKAADTAALYQGTIGALGGQFTSNLILGKFDQALLSSARNRATRILQGGAVGMTEEGLQELSEGLATDLGINRVVAREMGADSFANLVLGALGGGAPGAVRGAVAKGGAPEPSVAPPVTPAAPTPSTPAAEAPITPSKAAAPVEPEMMADLASIRTEPIELPPVAKAATTVAPEATAATIAAPQQMFTQPEPVVNPTEIVTPDKKWSSVTTGSPITIPMYQGRGEDKAKIYNGAQVPVAGKAQYFAPTGKEAAEYGDVTKHEVTLKNPLVITTDDQWRDLTKNKSGWKFPNPFGLTAEETTESSQRLKDYVTSQGHDSLIIKPSTRGDEAKTLRDVFGHDQAVVYGEPTQPAPTETFESIKPKYILPSTLASEVSRDPSFRTEVKLLNKLYKKGRVSSDIVANQLDQLLEDTKTTKEVKPLVRGSNIVLERLNRAARKGEISQEGATLANWLLSKNPNLAEDLAISIREPKENSPSGNYLPVDRLVTLFKDSMQSDTAIHEILHHTERMMPQPVQKGIRKLWFNRFSKALTNAMNGSDKNLQDYFDKVLQMHATGNEEIGKQAKAMISQGLVDMENYQYFSPSEFWAINASDIVTGKYEGDKSFLGKLKQWLKEFAEKIKSAFGFDSNAPIIRALDSLYKADGTFQSANMLTSGKLFENVEPPNKVKTERKNYKGDPAPLATWALEADNRYITDDFIYKMQDRLIDTKRVMQAIKKQVGDISVKWDTYKREILYHGRASDAIKKFLRYDIQSLIQSIDQAGLTMPEVKDYLHNRHAQERNETVAKINPTMPDGGSGIMTADAQKYLKSLDKEKRQKLEAVGKKVDEIVRKTQKILVDTGQETQETIDFYNKAYKHYVPLFREELDYVDTGAKGTGQGFSIRGAFSKRAMGSTKPVEDILSNIITNYERAVGRGEKNLVLQSLYGLAIQNPNPDLWMPINPDAPSSTKQAKEELLRMGISPTDVENLMREPMESYIDPKTGLVGKRLKDSIKESNYALPLRIEGKQRFLVLNPNNEEAKRMVLALKNMDLRDLHAAFNFFSKFTRWFVGVNTQYNPLFGMVNFIRDVQGSAVNLSTTPLAGKQSEVMTLAIKNLRGVYQALRAETMGEPITTDVGREFADMQSHGGQTGYRDSYQQKTEQHKIIEDTLARMEAGPAKKGLMYSLEFLSDVNDAMENATRLAVYQTSLKYAKKKDEAAKDEASVLAKTISVNFNKRGAWTQEASSLYGFFNSSVQGTARTLETLRGPAGKKIIAGGITLGVIQALALAMAGFDDDQPPPFVRDKNLVIPIPGTDKKYLTWPMPLGLNVLPNIGRTVAEIMLGGGKNAGKKLGHLFVAILDSFNPFGSSESVAQLISPTFADPIIALAENKDAFGRPIYKKDKETAPTPGHTRAKDTASTFSKEVSKFLNFISGGDQDKKGAFSPTPDQIDYVIGQVTGGIGRELMKIDQSLRSLGTGEELPPYKIPVLGRFYGDAASQAAQSGKFYESVTHLSQFENQIKGRIERGESYSSILRDNPEARLWRKANSVENEISALNKKKRDLVEKNAPKDQIKRIEEIKKRKMQQFNQEYDRAVK